MVRAAAVISTPFAIVLYPPCFLWCSILLVRRICSSPRHFPPRMFCSNVILVGSTNIDVSADHGKAGGVFWERNWLGLAAAVGSSYGLEF